MKTLLILRHGKSSWEDESLADHDRPLKRRGIQDAPKIGRLIRKLDLVPELIISSTAKRARQTTELVADACGYDDDPVMTESFYMGDPEDYIEVLQELDKDYPGESYQRVMIVGHNPGLEELLSALTNEPEHLPTGALAQVALPIEHWHELQLFHEGKLINLWVPRQLD